jgi:hypothetical protein
MLNSQEQELLDGLGDEAIPERGFGTKNEGWYSLRVESVEEQDNVDSPEHPFIQYNMKLRIVNGPSKGVEFLRISIPPKDHPDYMAKTYDPDGNEILDADGAPVYAVDETGKPVPNGRWKREAGLFQDVMTSIFVGDQVKGRKAEAKEKRKAMIMAAIEAAGGISAALQDKLFIAKFRLDKGVRTDRNTGETIVYSKSLQEKPRLKPSSFMSFDEAREKKYVLDPANLSPQAKTAAKVSLDL